MVSRRAMAAEPLGPEEDKVELPDGVDPSDFRRIHPVPLRFEAPPVTPLRPSETYHQRLDVFGLDEVVALVGSGRMLVEVAAAADVVPSALLLWIAKDEQRKLAVAEVRRLTASMWDEQATDVIDQASSWFGLEKAKQLASHYRWRAAKIDVQGYGEKQMLEVKQPLKPEEVDAKLMELATFWNSIAPTQRALPLPEGVTDVEDISELPEVLR